MSPLPLPLSLSLSSSLALLVRTSRRRHRLLHCARARGACVCVHALHQVPSNTSRYGSVDVGLIHYTGLDLNDLDAGQLAWLDADLAYANANRAQTPWIIVSSHFPVWSKAMADARRAARGKRLSLEHYLEDENVEHYDMYAEGLDYVEYVSFRLASVVSARSVAFVRLGCSLPACLVPCSFPFQFLAEHVDWSVSCSTTCTQYCTASFGV